MVERRSALSDLNAMSECVDLMQSLFQCCDCVSGVQSTVQEEEDSGGF